MYILHAFIETSTAETDGGERNSLCWGFGDCLRALLRIRKMKIFPMRNICSSMRSQFILSLNNYLQLQAFDDGKSFHEKHGRHVYVPLILNS